MTNSMPNTLEEARKQGYEPASEEEFQAALKEQNNLLGGGFEKFSEKSPKSAIPESVEPFSCHGEPDGVVCLRTRCINGYRYISTCHKNVCKQRWKKACNPDNND
jgi:hypothetical protein